MIRIDYQVLQHMTINNGQTLWDLTHKKPVLLVFLRHFGCQFCREAMDELSQKRLRFEQEGSEVVVVHMAENKVATEYLKRFGLDGVKHISDLNCRYYAAFGLTKGSFRQLFGLHSWLHGFSAQIKYGAEVGRHLGDSFQMPGVFVLFEGEIRDSYIHQNASDRPDYDRLVAGCLI